MDAENSLNALENSLEETIKGDKILEITGEISEGLIDTTLNSEILKSIPFFGTLYKAGQIALAVKDMIFAKKVLKFLFALKDTTSKQRSAFLLELEGETGQKPGEVLIMLLDRLDNMKKPLIIANLLKSRINEEISIADFLKCSHIIDKGYLPDLKNLEGYYNVRGYPKGLYLREVSESLYNLGLLDITHQVEKNDKNMFSRALVSQNNDKYKINRIGSVLYKNGISGVS